MKVAVFGASGRMGTQVCETVATQSDMELVAGVDIGDAVEPVGLADVAIDFTNPDAVMDHITWCLAHGVRVVVGTSGFTVAKFDQVKQMVSDHPDASVLIAPNFSVGAVLMMHVATLAAPYFDSAEIIEAHHPLKIDAPSGTAMATASAMAKARLRADCAACPDATVHELSGARGASIDGIKVHSVRLPGVIAQQEVRLASDGESLTIINDARSRASYMPGVLAGVRWVMSHSGLTIGLEPVLGLPSLEA
ncbi:MAG: 4-hydroxy-tetrahydrodipicolinate reductase [Propionibacteriaceae bacterium]|nr:4-hydroxy-tetrahydrodipicolinate reductase [Propionibacteriaceae bacterium]